MVHDAASLLTSLLVSGVFPATTICNVGIRCEDFFQVATGESQPADIVNL